MLCIKYYLNLIYLLVLLQMTKAIVCLLVCVFGFQTCVSLTDNQCVWYCVRGNNPLEATYCEWCAANPPITYTMCYSACQHTKKSFELSTICDACFETGTQYMPAMCKLACRNLTHNPNIPVCNICKENDLA